MTPKCEAFTQQRWRLLNLHLGAAMMSFQLSSWCDFCRFDATRMRERLLQTTSWKDVPHLDKAFIRQNMKNLVTLRMIGPPGQLQSRVKAPEP